ncbi:MAG: substrate-binding domain-containing protein [Verrucomicrobiae bacterium]|nr:substrate-binding domain-containing protein [Verrucomicrobiae bacterium]MCP5541383.1 substrate-binding domain-containing protein [Akkermansiaceae bacterium]
MSIFPRSPFPIARAVAVAALFSLAGCGKKEPGKAGGGTDERTESRGVVCATCLTLTNPFFKTIQEAMEDEAAKHGYEVLYVSGDFDAAKQSNQIKDFIVRKAAAIAINPCDSKAIGAAIKEANAAGIPVFTFDIKCQDPGAEVVSHIGTNNFQGGQLAGQAMIEALGESGGRIAILDFRAVESCLERVRGFKEVIDRFNASRPEGKIEIVAELPGNGEKDKGFRTTEDALQAHPDLVGIFAINDPSGLGAVAALEKAGRQDQVTVIAFDGQLEGKQAIKDGKIHADPVQFPEQIGRRTIQSVVAYLAGEDVPPDQPIDSALYRKADALQDPELR